MQLDECTSLDHVWKHVDTIHSTHYPNHTLRPILGNGTCSKPDYMFVFINPTSRNISSDSAWKGPRFPFIGTKPIWRIFHRAGLFDDELMEYIEKNPVWPLEFTNKVLNFLQSKSFYFTNIVKWTGADAELPNREKINLFLPILQREIEIVQPKRIVTFGLIPFEHLTKQKITLSDYYETTIRVGKQSPFDVRIGSCQTKIIPCYFPVGRGDPKRAVELLKMLER